MVLSVLVTQESCNTGVDAKNWPHVNAHISLSVKRYNIYSSRGYFPT